MYAFWRSKFLSPLQVADSILRWSYLHRNISRCHFLQFLLLFSSNDRTNSVSMAPASCALYLSTLFHCYTLCREHTIVLSSYSAPRIPRLSLPYTGQISQHYKIYRRFILLYMRTKYFALRQIFKESWPRHEQKRIYVYMKSIRYFVWFHP
jgi:hypothetical protein